MCRPHRVRTSTCAPTTRTVPHTQRCSPHDHLQLSRSSHQQLRPQHAARRRADALRPRPLALHLHFGVSGVAARRRGRRKFAVAGAVLGYQKGSQLCLLGRPGRLALPATTRPTAAATVRPTAARASVAGGLRLLRRPRTAARQRRRSRPHAAGRACRRACRCRASSSSSLASATMRLHRLQGLQRLLVVAQRAPKDEPLAERLLDAHFRALRALALQIGGRRRSGIYRRRGGRVVRVLAVVRGIVLVVERSLIWAPLRRVFAARRRV
mmetsp:Transcript_48795/g.135392  ORF Transcript_48795/g.135392 Transcript_48795/m.135392 type:complete len:268 (-) Transcript_48795:635-1438(-)